MFSLFLSSSLPGHSYTLALHIQKKMLTSFLSSLCRSSAQSVPHLMTRQNTHARTRSLFLSLSVVKKVVSQPYRFGFSFTMWYLGQVSITTALGLVRGLSWQKLTYISFLHLILPRHNNIHTYVIYMHVYTCDVCIWTSLSYKWLVCFQPSMGKILLWKDVTISDREDIRLLKIFHNKFCLTQCKHGKVDF